AVELGDLDQKIQITTELNNDIMKCIHDQNANHVVQKCIEHAPPQFIQFFLEDMYGHVVELSVHPYGCRVVHRVLEYLMIQYRRFFSKRLQRMSTTWQKTNTLTMLCNTFCSMGKPLCDL
ncbi:Os05g0327100, partial [Oryza sativa Japonica Group]